MNINNLTIEQMREILSGAPDGSERYSVRMGEYFYSPSSFHCFDKNKLVKMDRGVDLDLYESFIWLDDLRTAIAEHDNTDIGTEIDSFLDAFKSPELTDDRKDELTQDWKGMSGGVAFSLIERHADNWKEIDYMMNQWLEANKEVERHG